VSGDAHADGEGPWSPRWRRFGLAWVAATVPLAMAVAACVDTPDAYVAVLALLAFGPFTIPGVVVGLHAVRGAAPSERFGYRLLHVGLLVTLGVGVGLLAALAVWRPLLSAVPVGILASGSCLVGGLVVVVRRRAGEQALSVDLAEALASVVAVVAPLTVLWWPDVVDAEHAWFTVSAAVVFVLTVAASYWVALLWARVGPRPWGTLEGWEVTTGVAVVHLGAITAALHVALGASGFALPFPPLIGLAALCASAYLLIPLNAPVRMRDRSEGVPPEDQVRGGWLPTVIPLVGTAGLLAATAVVAGERPWAVPFAFGVVALLALLVAVRQVASMRETRRLYRQVAVTADERRRLLTELLERSVDDRRTVVEQLHRQAMSAYASFTALAATDRPPDVLAQASAVVGADLRRQAEGLHDLVQSLRPRHGGRRGQQLIASVRAYLATLYGERVAPALALRVADDLVLDWVVETVVLQVVQEALQNVWRHSGASAVEVEVHAIAGVVVVRVTDDGEGFDPGARPEAGGIATMRASAAVLDGEVSVESSPGAGTTVVARLGTHTGTPSTGAAGPALRSVSPLDAGK
jgi:signal transduction histidine kinase